MHEQRKRRMIDGIAEEAESTARDDNISDLCRLTKKIVQVTTNTVTSVRDKWGKLLMMKRKSLKDGRSTSCRFCRD